MRIAIIGNYDTGSYAQYLAAEINKSETTYIYDTRQLGYDQTKFHKISDVLGRDKDNIEHIIVVQSHAFLHNDTDIPLFLYKRELGNPTVNNPTRFFANIYYIMTKKIMNVS